MKLVRYLVLLAFSVPFLAIAGDETESLEVLLNQKRELAQATEVDELSALLSKKREVEVTRAVAQEPIQSQEKEEIKHEETKSVSLGFSQLGSNLKTYIVFMK